MATAYPELILQRLATGTGNGTAVGFGTQMRFGTDLATGLKINQDRFPVPFKVRFQMYDTVAGTASGTVIVEDSYDGTTYATLASIAFQMAVADGLSIGKSRLFNTKKQWIRARISAITGGTAPGFNVYCILGGGSG